MWSRKEGQERRGQFEILNQSYIGQVQKFGQASHSQVKGVWFQNAESQYQMNINVYMFAKLQQKIYFNNILPQVKSQLYLSMEQNNDISVTFIRHAQSLLNIASHKWREQHNLPYIWQQLCKHDSFLKGVKYNPDYLDCCITQKGVKQCLKARQEAKKTDYDLILVSPLHRTLQTCSYIFQNTKSRVIAEPILAQAFRSSCDISQSLEQKIKKFPDYDFALVKEKGDFWYLENQSQENQLKYMKLLETMQGSSYTQKQRAILDLMTQTMIYETPTNLRNRAQKIKERLQDYSKKHKKIAVIAHFNTINYTCSTKFGANDEPEDSLDVHNCQIYETSLQNLLKYK